jgi:hypothetical protein
LRVNYQGSMGHHLSQLMNLNRYDGSEYNATLSTANSRPNPLYSAFNYRANNLNSNYNALVTEVQKRYSNGLQFQFSFVWSKLMDEGSDLFAVIDCHRPVQPAVLISKATTTRSSSTLRELSTTRRTSRR